MVSPIIESEEDPAARGGLQRCLNSLLSQFSNAIGASQESVFSETREREVMFTQYDLSFAEGVDPHRVEYILDSLFASLTLWQDKFALENAAVLASLPVYCSGCDSFGHSTNDCMHFRGRVRVEAGFLPAAQHVSGEYRLQKLGRTIAFRRVVSVNNARWEVGTASGRENNCLIDTIRQSLRIPSSDALLDAVRNDLAREFPEGAYAVRTETDQHGANFLEFQEHTRAVARLLVRHAGRDVEDVTLLKFICMDLDTERHSAVPASRPGGREVVILRENGNHFVPVTVSHDPVDSLIPWNSSVVRRRKMQAQDGYLQ